jgi:hypothetical protein
VLKADPNDSKEFLVAALKHAEAVHSCWGIKNGPVVLGEAHRFLDPESWRDVLVTCTLYRCDKIGVSFPPRRLDGAFSFLTFSVLLPTLEKWTWDWVLEGKLIASGIDAADVVHGDRVDLPGDRLKLLQPDFQNSCASAFGRVVLCDILVERPRDQPVVRLGSAAKVSKSRFVKWYCNDLLPSVQNKRRPLPVEQEWAAAKAKFGKQCRTLLKECRNKYAPSNWKRGRGRPSDK